MSQTSQKIIEELKSSGSPEKATCALRFFKTALGQYGHGDKFLGVTVPEVRKFVRKYRWFLTLDELPVLLDSPWHEVRFFALAMLVEWSKEKTISGAERHRLANFYLAHRSAVNNWDLVDISAPWVLGPVLCDDAERLWALARSGELWQERISVLTTQYDIRRGRFAHTLSLAEYFLSHRHDLMHKAVGWMLREVGKRDEAVLRTFLAAHAPRMPRTMFRYATERL